jgi:hypothetical protein
MGYSYRNYSPETKFMAGKVFKITAVIGAIVFAGFGLFMWNWQRPMLSFDESKIPYGLVTANPVEYSGIYTISKFRSGAGHDYSQGSYNGETCRSMKHYFNVGRNSNIVTGNSDIKVYAPFDGRITSSSTQAPGTQIRIASDKFPFYSARVFHIYLLPGIKFGSHVASGQQIATIGPKDGMDVAIEANALFKGNINLSVFDVMTDEAFSAYAKQGFKRSDFIISKQYRDTHPFKCGVGGKQEEFVFDPSHDWTEDFIFLKEDPFAENRGPGAKPIHIGPPILN